jgi:hypothetical protein
MDLVVDPLDENRLSGDDNGLRAERDTVTRSHNLWPRVEAAKERVAAQSPLDGGLTELPQGSLAFGVRDADRWNIGSGDENGC